ncbi:MAG TPA: (2Fe-2S)-binding protein [Fimbriimonadaceae bacterium]|nr:(2Fe-2S)-binding protein [Fimbriimonadaceae bacterium]HRJ34258.1 (2Fe-2S)-binding protein [Fimbriimonadaceae bacterium]
MCVCHRTSFAELKEAGCTSLEEIQAQFGCGTGCGSCLPYLKLYVETGETAFPVLSAPWMASRQKGPSSA